MHRNSISLCTPHASATRPARHIRRMKARAARGKQTNRSAMRVSEPAKHQEDVNSKHANYKTLPKEERNSCCSSEGARLTSSRRISFSMLLNMANCVSAVFVLIS